MNPLKKIMMLLFFVSVFVPMMATLITVGTGTTFAGNYEPWGSFYGYQHAAELYTSAEIGAFGNISSMAVMPGITKPVANIPIKIYMKMTTETALASTNTFNSMRAGATLVYTGTIASLTAGAWQTVTLDAMFTYTGSNLLVLTESTYGGGGFSPYPTYYFSTAASQNWYKRADNTALTGDETGTVNGNRANIQMNVIPMEGPAQFSMNPTTINFGQSFLNVTSTATNVTVSNVGGTAMQITSAILGGANPGGFIKTDTNTYPYTLASGSSMSFSVAFRPTAVQSYSATIVVTDNLTRTSHTLTLEGIGFDPSISTFPYTESFDGATFVPLGWANYRIQGSGSPGIWDRQTTGTSPACTPHSGAAMARYNSYSLSSGTQGALVSPPITLPSSNYRVKFWMYRDDGYPAATYDDEMVSVWMNSAPNLTGADSLGVIHRRSNLFPIEAANGWYAYAMNFPATSTGVKFVIFKAISKFGNNMFLDDVTFEQQPTGSPLPAMLISPANNAINQFPTITLNWWPDGTGPAPLGYRLSFGTNNPPTNVLNNSDVALTTSYTPTLSYGNTYYWQIIPYNASGPAAGCPVWSFTTMNDPTVTVFPYMQNFDSVTVPALPIGWAKLIGSTSTSAVVNTSITSPHSAPNNVYLYNSNDLAANLVLVTPPTTNLGITRIRFWARCAANSNVIVGTVANPANPASFTPFQTVELTATYTEYMVSFAGYNGMDHYIGLKHGNGATYRGLYIDDFTWQLIPTGAQVEVNLTSLAYGEVYNNSTAVQTLMISNSGLTDLSYSVVTSGPTVTTNIVGPHTIAPGSNQACMVTIQPTMEGTFSGSITINSNDPQNPSLQIPITATVLPALAPGLVEVGNGILEDTSLPMEPYYNYSFSQTIYLQEELNQPNSRINSIFFKYNGNTAWADSVFIYMGSTTRTQFNSTTDYVPASELTLVYEGLIDVPAVAGWVEIPLTLPYSYDNVSNLVVCVDKDMPPYHDTNDDFYCTAVTTNRSIEQHSDQATSNSNVNTPLAGTLRMTIPNTRFMFQIQTNEPLFAAIPSTVNFGQVNVDNTSTPINVQIRNAGGGSLTINQPITLTGVDASQFSLTDTHTYPQTLTSGQSFLVSVTFTPTSAGVKSAQLNVSDNLIANVVTSKSGQRSMATNGKESEQDRTLHVIPISGSGNDGVIHTFPYNQGFEDAAFPNLGWTVADGANAANGWRRRTTTGNAHTGTGYAVVGTLPGNHWMMTPKFEIGPQSNTLRYWIKDSTDTPDSAATSVTEYLRILVSTTNADSSSFTTQLGNYLNSDIPITYEENTIDLSAYNGQNIYLCFLRYSTGGKFLYMDDFSIANASGIVLNPPTNLTYQVQNENNVVLNWNAPSAATGTTLTGYKVYRNNSLVYTLTGAAVVTVTDESVPAGTYSYKVSAVYDQGESGYSDPVGVEITGGNPNELIADNFESYPDFSLTFDNWTTNDVDFQNTYNFAGATYPNLNSPKAYMVFNPSATTPPLTTVAAHSGNKMLVCFDSQVPPNNDWLITPRIHLGTESSINFWAKSFTGQYGLENFKVAISTTDNNLSSFTNVITGGNAVAVPVGWTQYDYDISNYDGQFVYIAFRCVSNNAFALLLDDFKVITTGGTSIDDPAPLPTGTALLGNYPNPFNPETIIHYTLKNKGNVLIEIYNTKGQKVTTLENTVRDAGHYYVNWSGKDQNGRAVTSGVYFYKMKSGTYSSTKKMILLR